ncbi:MAG: hypothetical protein V2A73_07420, partial [Pseudomonadota bacterium]
TREARIHYQKGQSKYDLAEYESAIVEFKKAYELSDAPGLLFNIAQAHRRNGDCKQALRFYKNYLRRQPDAPNREEVEKLIADMEACSDGGAQGDVVAPAATSPAPPDDSSTPPASPDPATASVPVSAASNATPAEPTSPSAPSAPSVAASAEHGGLPMPADAANGVTSPLPDTPTTELRSSGRGSSGHESWPLATMPWMGLGTVGAGGLLAVAGVLYGYRASALSDEISDLCPPAAKECDGKALAEKQTARDAAEIKKWVWGGAGAFAIVSGAILYYTSQRQGGRAKVTSMSVESLPGGLAVSYSHTW